MDHKPVINGTIERGTGLPKYYQLKHILREIVTSMSAGTPVPSESDLCQKFDVSRTTVRKALSDLIQEGLIYTIQGKGTFAGGPKKRSSWVAQTGGLYADMTERGFSVTMKQLDLSIIPAEENIARELQVREGEDIVKLVRLRFVDEKPFDICTNYLVAKRYPGIEKMEIGTHSLYSTLRSVFGVKFVSGVRLIEAGSCTPDEARLLQIPNNSPLLIMRSTMFDEKGEAIEHGVVRQRSDLSQIIINVIPH